jgi:DNA polymerase III psi subunit
MQLSQYQRSVLDEMGITVWGLRTATKNKAETAEKIEPASAQQKLDVSASIWFVLASGDINAPEQRLLNSMTKAIGLDRNNVAMLNQEQLMSVPDTTCSGKRILIFGTTDRVVLDQANPEIVRQENDSCWIATYSLSELMHEPNLKAAAWQALKLLKTTY